MDLDELSLSLNQSPQALPKSVKVRTTCNACQLAKIRCGHEKPACRRCQKQRTECVYSMSRRLGRPAKKLSQHGQGDSKGQQTRQDGSDPEKRRKKGKKSNKKKNIDDPRKMGGSAATDPLSSYDHRHGHGESAKDNALVEDCLPFDPIHTRCRPSKSLLRAFLSEMAC